jgi:hypothetical protein
MTLSSGLVELLHNRKRAFCWRSIVQKGLKIPWGKPCAGSSPAVRTREINGLEGSTYPIERGQERWGTAGAQN